MPDRESLYDSCDRELTKLKAWLNDNKVAFDSMNLKLYDAAMFDDFDAYPYIKKALDTKFYSSDSTLFNDFTDQSYDLFIEWCDSEGIDFRKMYHQLGRTSSFYLHDRNLISIDSKGIDYDDTIYSLVNHFGWPGSFETTKDGLVDRTWSDENWDDDSFIENNLDYIASGDFYKDVVNDFSDVIKVYDYIKGFKENQVSYYKDWLDSENDWLADSHPELMDEAKLSKSEYKYVITINRRGKQRDTEPMTIKQLQDYFSYTLEVGRSWQNERGNSKIPTSFNNIDKFVDALNNAKRNAALNGDPAEYYTLKDIIKEAKMGSVSAITNKILEGADIAKVIGMSVTEGSDESAYYKIVYGYQLAIVKVDHSTTDYGALVDILIDNLEKEGVGDPYLIDLDKAEEEYNPDEYTVGGNHSLALVHNGNFNIEEITSEKAQELAVEDHVKIYEEL